MEKNLKIEKLSDIVEWADGMIRDGGYNEEKYRSDATTAYCNVKAYELWRIRDAALKGMERHSVYTDALNQDIAAKAAKIELLEKEIEGRKEGYHALKEQLDHMTALEKSWYENAQELVETCKSKNAEIEKLKKEVDKWQDLAKMNRDTICDQYGVCEEFKNKIAELEEKVKHQRENLDGINKTLEIKTKENESLIVVRNNLDREIEAHESENARLSKRIMEKNQAINTANDAIVSLRKEIEKLKVDLIHEREKNEKLAKDHAELENDMRKVSVEISDKDKVIADLEESKRYWKHQSVKDQDEINTWKKKFGDSRKETIDRNVTIVQLEEQVKNLEKELNESYKGWDLDSKNHSKRDMTLVDEIAKKNDEIKKLKESIEYHKNQERIRTDQLRATESKVEELWEEIERLRDLGEHWKRSYFSIRYSLNKLKDELKEDDHGRAGFKRYVKNALIEAEGNKNEANEIITEAVRSAYTEWDKTQKEKEETEVKGVGRTSSGRYPWGAKVNDIPCGEDSIE